MFYSDNLVTNGKNSINSYVLNDVTKETFPNERGVNIHEDVYADGTAS